MGKPTFNWTLWKIDSAFTPFDPHIACSLTNCASFKKKIESLAQLEVLQNWPNLFPIWPKTGQNRTKKMEFFQVFRASLLTEALQTPKRGSGWTQSDQTDLCRPKDSTYDQPTQNTEPMKMEDFSCFFRYCNIFVILSQFKD